MIGTIAIVLLLAALAVGGFFVYKKHKLTIDREAKRIADQAQELADKAKEKVEGK